MTIVVNYQIHRTIRYFEIYRIHGSKKRGGAILIRKASSVVNHLKNLAQKRPNNATTTIILRPFPSIFHNIQESLLR